MAVTSAVPWFDELLEAHLGSLYRCALQLCNGRAADAEDLVQDAALRALRCQDQLRSRDSGKAWLFRVLTTTHLNRARTLKRRAEAFASDLEDHAFEEALASWTPISTAEEQLLRESNIAQLQATLNRLAPELLAALWLTDVEEFSQREVATMLSIPEGTVASRVYRARRAMRTHITAFSDVREGAGGVR